MFDSKPKSNAAALEDAIERCMIEMNKEDPHSEEYLTALTHLERLIELKTKDRPQRLSRDTLAIVAGNLAGIVIIVGFELTHPAVSAGFKHILKPK